jgi:hypothetical protein
MERTRLLIAPGLGGVFGLFWAMGCSGQDRQVVLDVTVATLDERRLFTELQVSRSGPTVVFSYKVSGLGTVVDHVALTPTGVQYSLALSGQELVFVRTAR